MYHSKLSGKKKLVLDAEVLTQAKSYSNEFTYSFKIEKHYFNVIQVSSDKYELRIDNRSFTTIMTEEKFRPREEKPASKSTAPIKPAAVQSSVKKPVQNNDANFFNDTDFEFDDSQNTKKPTNFQQKAPIFNQRGSVNAFSQPKVENKMPIAPAQTVGVLIDFNEPLNNKGQQIYSEKALFSQLQFDNNEKQSQEIYNHNQQIFNNLQIDFNDDTQENNYSPMDKNQMQNQNNVNRNNNNSIFNNIPNNFQYQNDYVNNNNINNNNLNNNNFGNQQMDNNNNFSFNPNQIPNNNVNYNNVVSHNNQIPNQAGLINNNQIMNNQQVVINNSNDLFGNNSDNGVKQNASNGQQIAQPPSESQTQNQFKERILGKGLIDLDNLLEDNNPSQRPNHARNSYNFDLSGPKIQLNPSNYEVNKNIVYTPPMNINMNMSGYGMPPHPNFNPQLNNMYMMNNQNMSMNPGMNMGYPQQQYSNNNYPNNTYNPNVNMSMQQGYNYNQTLPQQNKTNNNTRGVNIDFF